MCLLDRALLCWLLVAKTLVCLLPMVPVLGVLSAFGLRRTSWVVLSLFSIAMFYFMAFDLASVGFAGYHASDYVPHIRDILAHPEQQIWQWGGEQLRLEMLLLLGVFAVLVPGCLVTARWAAVRMSDRFRQRLTIRTLRIPAAALVLIVLGIVPALDSFRDRAALERISDTLPLAPGLREAFEYAIQHREIFPGNRHIAGGRGGLAEAANAPTVLSSFPVKSKTGEDRPRNRAESQPAVGEIGRNLGMEELSQRAAEITTPDSRDQQDALKLVREAVDPGPADSSAFVNKHELPNIVLIILESFRPSAVSPDLMKRLDLWSKQGLRLQRHYSGSNCSHLGLFSLFYGRTPLGYDQTLEREIPPQMLDSLRRSGYRVTFLTSGEVKGFRRLDKFINNTYCDEVITEGDFTLKGMKEWPDSDRRKLARARSIVNNAGDRAQCVFFYLVSSHYRYPFPPEFAIFKESPTFWHFLNPRSQIQNHLNRYSNAVLFLESELMKFIQSVDPQKNIIIVTGDHGESMGEDGVFTHASRMSDVQLRVPFAMVGPGITPREVPSATVHTDVIPTLLHALAGRNVPVKNCQGRDLLADSLPEDRVVLVPANGPRWEGFMIVRGNKRQVFRTTTAPGQTPSVEFVGMVDESGQDHWRMAPNRQVRYVLDQKH